VEELSGGLDEPDGARHGGLVVEVRQHPEPVGRANRVAIPSTIPTRFPKPSHSSATSSPATTAASGCSATSRPRIATTSNRSPIAPDRPLLTWRCQSCHMQRELIWAQWAVDELPEEVPHRQVVFTIPKRLRPFFRYDRALLGDLAACAWQALEQNGPCRRGRLYTAAYFVM